MYIVALILSYLIGSISFSFVIAKWVKGVDIRKHGSGNAGATNTLRVLGVGPGIGVLVLDIAKGVLAVWLGYWLAADALWVAVVCGMLAIIGHNWPVFFGFRGGKGIATTIGVMATLSPLPFLIAGVIGLLAVIITRYVSLGSLIFTGLLPIVLLLMSRPLELILASVLVFALAAFRHRGNIVKMLNGNENKIGKRAM